LIRGRAKFVEDGSVEVNGQRYKGKHTLIAVGGHPLIPDDVPGAEHGTDSDGFFEFTELPKKTVVVGAGYIAVELAGILAELGSETHLLIRYDHVLRNFDHTLSEALTDIIEKGPIKLHKRTQVKLNCLMFLNSCFQVKKVVKHTDGSLTVHTDNETIEGVSKLIWSIGRHPSTKSMNLDKVGVKVNEIGHVQVDDYQNTTASRIYALGDACGRWELTPGLLINEMMYTYPFFQLRLLRDVDCLIVCSMAKQKIT
jgi:glutathione reductase (NADPH)